MGAQTDGRVPLEAVAQVPDALGHLVLRIGKDLPGLSGAHVVPVDAPTEAPCVRDVGIPGIHGDVAALTPAHLVFVLEVRDHCAGHPAGHRDGGIVLLGTVQAVGELIVDRDPVELRCRLIPLGRPRATPVERDRGAPVVALHHDVGVVGVDPQRVAVAVRHRGHGQVARAAVHRLVEENVVDPDRVLVLRISGDAHVVPRTVPELLLAGELAPRVAAVVGAVHAAGLVLGLDDGPHPVGVGRRHRDASLPEEPLRQPRGELLPAVAPVLAPIDAAIHRA